MASINYADAASYRAFAEEIHDELVALAVYGSNTMQRITTHDNVKGKKVLTQLLFNKMGRRYKKDFGAPANTMSLKPRELVVEAGKFETSIVPQEFEDTYLGDLKRTKFSNVSEYPFERYILEKMAMQQNREIADAIWQGVKTGTPADTDTIDMIFDGFLHKIADAITATTLTPHAVSGGAYTVDNVVDEFEAQFDNLDSAYQSLPIGVFVAPHLYNLYLRGYRKKYTANSEIVRDGVAKLDFVNAFLIREPGMGTSNRVLMTPEANLNVGFDSIDSVGAWEMEKVKRQLDYWADFKIGVEFTFLQDEVVAVNNLA